ncbi:MAG: hypothetical protein J5589_00080 [Firmicutes bacterium]|nr:hypothetical protein [Bacillota bacterium]
MKRTLLAIFLCIVLVMLSACSGGKEAASSGSAASESEKETVAEEKTEDSKETAEEKTEDSKEAEVTEPSETVPAGMSVEEFETKWQSADWNSFENDPSGFLDDFLALSEYVSSATFDNNPFEAWEMEARGSSSYFVKTCTLLGKTMAIRIGLRDSEEGTVFSLSSIQCESGRDDDLAFGKAVALYALDNHPDGCEISAQANNHDSTEEELRKLLVEGYEIGMFQLVIFKKAGESYEYAFSMYYTASGASASDPGFAQLYYRKD